MNLMEFVIVMMLGVGLIVTGGVVMARVTFALGRPVFRQCARIVQPFLAWRPGSQKKVPMTERLQALSAANQECVADEAQDWSAYRTPAVERCGQQVIERLAPVLEVIPVVCYEADISAQPTLTDLLADGVLEPVWNEMPWPDSDIELPEPVLQVMAVEEAEIRIPSEPESMTEPEPAVAEVMTVPDAPAESVERPRVEVLADFRRRFRVA